MDRVQVPVLYHRKRERFFDWWDNIFKGIAILGGSSAVAQLGGAYWSSVAAGSVAVGSTLSLVFSLAERSRRHADLAAKFLALEADIVGTGERDYTEAQINHWDSRVRAIGSEEPTSLSGLVSLCHNEIKLANGGSENCRHLNPWQRLTIHFFDHPAKARKVRTDENAAT